MKKSILCGLAILLIFEMCTPSPKKIINTETENDVNKLGSPKSINEKPNVDSLRMWAFENLDMQKPVYTNDTLVFTITSWSLWYPLGTFDDINLFSRAYPMMEVESKSEKTYDQQEVSIFDARFKRSVVRLIKDDEAERLEIVYAKIIDKEIVFENGLKIGDDKSSFFKLFFRKSISNVNRVNFIKVNSALEGMSHTYVFLDDKLASIELNTDYLSLARSVYK